MSSLSRLAAVAFLFLIPHMLRIGLHRRSEIRGGNVVLWWIIRFYGAFWHRLTLPTGFAPLPEHGPAILIANHTCGIDNFLLQASCRRVLGFLIVQDWYDFWMCRPFCRLTGCIPVKRDGRDLSATRAALRALDAGRVVPIFPEGKILPRSGRGFGEPKPGAAFLAVQSGAPVVPAYISGTPPTSNIFKALGTPSNARVVFGPPVDLDFVLSSKGLSEREKIQAATSVLMKAIRSLRDEYPPERPVE